MIPGCGAVDAGLPRVARLHEPAVLELPRVLAHVPDVARLVLRVPVEGLLDRRAALGHGVADDGAVDPEDPLRLVGDDLVVGLRRLAVLGDALVVEAGARLERQVRGCRPRRRSSPGSIEGWYVP